MKCPHCGKEHVAGVRFCTVTGKPIPDAEAETQLVSQVQPAPPTLHEIPQAPIASLSTPVEDAPKKRGMNPDR